MALIIEFENIHNAGPVAGDLVRIWNAQKPFIAAGTLGIITGEINEIKKNFIDILVIPDLPIVLKNGFIDEEKCKYKLENINIDCLQLSKKPASNMLFTNGKKNGFKKVKIYKLHL